MRSTKASVTSLRNGSACPPAACWCARPCGSISDGLDPALPVFRDGVEFGWRAHLNGYSVVTTPSAQVTHRQVGRAGLRPHGLTGRRPGKVDRLLGMLVVAGHAPRKTLPLVWLRLVWSCLVRAVGYLIGKVPGRALDEMLALGSFLAHPRRLDDVAQADCSPSSPCPEPARLSSLSVRDGGAVCRWESMR